VENSIPIIDYVTKLERVHMGKRCSAYSPRYAEQRDVRWMYPSKLLKCGKY